MEFVVTEAAKREILALLQAEGSPGVALRIAISGRGPGGFQYELEFVGEEDRAPADAVIDVGGFEVVIGPESASHLEGATLDHVVEGQESGFRIDNPNPLWSDPRSQAVQQVLDAQVNPAVAMHGGYVTLLEVRGEIAYISLGGGCQGCGMADVTLKQGIDQMIREAVPEIREVIDTTDHAAGTNPYYQPSKGGGQSPFA